MWNELFVLGLAAFFGIFLRWGFKTLPREEWQVLASIPVEKDDSESWKGVNLTYYGVFVAGSCAAASALALLLLGSLGIPGSVGLLIAAGIFGICLPTSWIAAKLVERKENTLTIGGASFIGIMSAPVIVWAADWALFAHGGTRIPIIPTLAALAIAYAHGEGLGRLACISFGCCYGKPLSACGPILRRLFTRRPFIFVGKTKKISYESALDGQPVVPIQAVTSVVCLAAGLLGMCLFLKGLFSWALVLTIVITQAWRVLSETARADYRGEGKWSAYQLLAGVSAACTLLAVPFLPSEAAQSP
jgi:hypothetical protein